MLADTDITPEFSRIIDLAAARTAPQRVEISARAPELAALAARFDLLGLTALSLEGQVTWDPAAKLYSLDGRIGAHATQACVVTLEPVDAAVDAGFRRLYTPVPPRQGRDGTSELVVEAEADDPPDVVPDERLDVGEVAAEQLALALDPYPRKPGAELPQAYSESGAVPEESPFAVLASLKRPQ
jgi:uncharacterized metal-binding protein YceD (DUF177 family)